MAERDTEPTGLPRESPVRPDDPVDDMATAGPRNELGADEPSASADPTRRIVVGIDGSDASRDALRWALAHASETGTEVHAIAVWHQPLQFGANALGRTPAKDFEDEAHAWLERAIHESGESGQAVHAHTERGDPSTLLLDHALRADLLVVGNRGRGALAGAVLGSVALRVAHHAQCPVVLVPAPQSR
jgi:nucleotide-binding universal stress UspA family protein